MKKRLVQVLGISGMRRVMFLNEVMTKVKQEGRFADHPDSKSDVDKLLLAMKKGWRGRRGSE